jgi:three-Cys-motif partner protein
LDWKVVFAAGRDRAIELFINFPVYDININVLKGNPSKVSPADVSRMDRFWGDRSWYNLIYEAEPDLLDGTRDQKVRSIKALVTAYMQRLQKVAGFNYVPKPLPIRLPSGVILYYLFFASPNNTGRKIVDWIFRHHGGAGIVG